MVSRVEKAFRVLFLGAGTFAYRTANAIYWRETGDFCGANTNAEQRTSSVLEGIVEYHDLFRVRGMLNWRLREFGEGCNRRRHSISNSTLAAGGGRRKAKETQT